ncbi:RAMP superfamily CRISPR-associated protein [Sulfolobus tengchongensis]|uniref:RAMP superfamily CRISPR-associated protein n=1 Tax=Sulfolobus tengchongensis TaxID=207809 RepID=A0AAX4L2I2_9CREN
MTYLTINVSIRNLTSLTVGGGSTIGSADIPLNVFGVPPSSLKGAMRTAIHNLLPPGFSSCGEIEPSNIKMKHNTKPCDVCSLFGYPDSKDGGCFTIVSNTDISKINKFLITRVSIDDKTQKAKRGSLFTQEVIPPNTELNFTIYYNQICGERLLKLLLYSLLALRYWRLGRNAMIDVKVNNNICVKVKCDSEMNSILSSLSSFLW